MVDMRHPETGASGGRIQPPWPVKVPSGLSDVHDEIKHSAKIRMGRVRRKVYEKAPSLGQTRQGTALIPNTNSEVIQAQVQKKKNVFVSSRHPQSHLLREAEL